MKGVRHHLLDVVPPRRVFTAHNFVEQGQRAIKDIAAREKLPIIAGGSGFYIDALLGHIALPNVSPNPKLRAKLEQKSVTRLLALLKKKDPRRAKTIEPHNKRRLIRALEIVSALGKVPAYSGFVNPNFANFDILWIGMTLQSKVIDKKIRRRLLARMRQGMVEETRRLHKAGLTYRRMEQLGLEYRAIARYLQGKISRDQMIDELNRDIRRYAKRQLAYWKRNKDIHWFDPGEKVKIRNIVQKFVSGR